MIVLTASDPAQSGREHTPQRHPPAASVSLLDAAIEQGGLHPVFQPKVRMADKALSGFEALARIATPQSAPASPLPYVALAERNNRIDALTFTMARHVARHARDFASAGCALPVTINISPVSLGREDFPERLAGAVCEAGLSCTQAILDVTATGVEALPPRAAEVMTRLRGLGFGLALDDFGSGCANIDWLHAFPFSELKIDPSFTQQALEENFARAGLEACIKLAHKLGLRVTAEGVETQAMWDFLAARGVDEAQGFLVSRPLPPAEIRDLIAGRRALG